MHMPPTMQSTHDIELTPNTLLARRIGLQQTKGMPKLPPFSSTANFYTLPAPVEIWRDYSRVR
jgi:hypothetical protein